MLEICLNGTQKTVKSETVSSLIEELQLQNKKIAVELNRTVVQRANFESTRISDGDSIEVISFVGGG